MYAYVPASYLSLCVCVLNVVQLPSCAKLFATRWTVCSPPGSSVHGILQASTLQWVAVPSSRGSSQPRDLTHVSSVSCVGHVGSLRQHHQGSPPNCSVTKSCCDPMDRSMPSVSVLHYLLEFAQTPGDSEGQRRSACCGPWGHNMT